MPDHMPLVSADLLVYLREHSLRETDVQKQLREATDALPECGWEVAPEQAQFLAFMVQAISAKKILELGTFTGHSSLAMALALPADGKLITCDMEPTYTDIAEEHWRQAGVSERIELHMGPALDSVAGLIGEGLEGTFDMAFIDANKKDYGRYYESALVLLRPGGVIAIDNVFWGGRILDQNDTEKSTNAIRALNDNLHTDERVSLSMLPLNDGLTLAWKRPG